MQAKARHILLLGFLILCCCQCSVKEPQADVTLDQTPKIFPDYTNVEIPSNIAPLNFQIREEGNQFVVKVEAKGETLLLVKASDDKAIQFPADKWSSVLQSNVGDSLRLTLFAQEEGKWRQYKPFSIKVSKESIDRYLTFRLIEPSYMTSGIMGLYQYDLEKNELSEILTNHRSKLYDNQQEQCCMNCHYSQKEHPENKMFYYRGPSGGMMLTYNGELKKMSISKEKLPGGTVYGCWHPHLPFIAFSSCMVRQTFPNIGQMKVHAYDYYSDLVLFDIEKGEISNILKTKDKNETFPHWNAKGDYLYFCSSDSSITSQNINLKNIESQKYDLYRIAFDTLAHTFGEPEPIYNASGKGLSAMHPRLSPDDRFVLFTVSNFGPNAYTQKAADLYLIDNQTGAVRNLEEINSSESECYHSWSSHSNWFVFVSRRDDGNYGRLYFSHIDSTGKASKPFALPHEDPQYDPLLMKSYNAPEFSNTPVLYSQQAFEKEIFDKSATEIQYKSSEADTVDAYTGASVITNP